MTIEQRRKALLLFIRTKEQDDTSAQAAVALAEEIFSMADDWHAMADALTEMAVTQRQQLEFQKSMFLTPVMKQEKN
jgi:hypothetical protein